ASTTTGVAPLAVNFSVSASDPENNSLTYSWDLNGDGTFGDNTSTSTSTSFNYTVAGTYTVTVRVSDGTNSPVSRSVGITVSGTSTPPTTTSGTALPWMEDFTLSNGTNVDNGSTKWSLVNTGMTATATFSVQSNQLTISDVDVEVKWLSEEITVSSAGSIKVSAKFNSNNAGNLDPDDYLGLYYTINGGYEVLISNQFDDFASNLVAKTFTVSAGDKIRLIAKARNTSTNEIYYLDDVKVESVAAGAKITSIEESISQVTVFPNPTSDKITFTGVLPGTAFEIYSMTGEFVKSGLVSESFNNVEDLSVGVYFIRLKDKSVKTFRIIKQ
ncbi:MAG: T9SS type A sorting domain-containing protein, partial [Bacteroidota bacterium]|nr:T9SS type A sorting domain-containing protein [Bacteroidota bacterium]